MADFVTENTTSTTQSSTLPTVADVGTAYGLSAPLSYFLEMATSSNGLPTTAVSGGSSGKRPSVGLIFPRGYR